VATTQRGTSSSIGLTGNFFTFNDNVSDATLAAKPFLYRQPGTIGTALDRFVPPGGYGVICSHKDRLFTAGPFGNKVYYSSFYVDGEQPWFNPQFSFQVHGGSGPITGLASLDGRLIIFKRDSVFVVDGDGPPENGGSGAEFSPPLKISAELGCVDARSIVGTPMGVMYRSTRGIELLNRSLQVQWVGERVVDTVDDNPSTRTAIHYNGRVYFFLAVDDTPTAPGACALYDMSQDCWSVQKYTFQSTYGRNVRSASVWETTGNNVRLVLIGGDATVPLYFQSGTTDNEVAIPWTIESGWIRPTGSLGRFRVHDAMFLGKKVSSGNTLTVSAAYDFKGYSQSRTWDLASLSDTLIDVTLQPKLTQPVTFKVKATSPGYGIDVLGLCFLVSPKAGAYQMAEYKKG
jgi:hypothetical protein